MYEIKLFLNPLIILECLRFRAVVLHDDEFQIFIGALLNQGTHADIEIRGMILVRMMTETRGLPVISNFVW